MKTLTVPAAGGRERRGRGGVVKASDAECRASAAAAMAEIRPTTVAFSPAGPSLDPVNRLFTFFGSPPAARPTNGRE